MIEVSHLTKQYPGGFTAVQDVSFSVSAGDVVGLLGPNGAGKSTIMRILSGYVWPSGGQVTLGGLDITREGIAVRKRLGYLPENCPLYPEMRVGEYLRYRANIKRVSSRHRAKRIARVLEQCDLGDVQDRLIGKLSKGYRQRVGIADALVHSPDVLILDEPTIGLDPHQIVQIRKLIQNLAEEHTVLISSHILSEIESTCNRVIVLHQGSVRDSGTVSELEARWLRGGEVVVEVKAPLQEVQPVLAGVEGVERLECREDEGWTRSHLFCEKGKDCREAIYGAVQLQGWCLRELRRRNHSLEEAFLRMTDSSEPVSPEAVS